MKNESIFKWPAVAGYQNDSRKRVVASRNSRTFFRQFAVCGKTVASFPHACERESERVQARRVEYQVEITGESFSRFKFLDEAGSNLAMTRLYGRGAKGERVIETVPQNYGENITLLASLSLAGVAAPMTINGAVDASVFKTYTEKVWCPTWAEGEVVIMDNLSVHKVAGSRELIEAKGAKLI